jgi:nucleotide-binding universal stress UspA family protein
VDDSDECLAAVDWAADEAATRGTGLRLVNASQWPEHQLQAVKPSRETRTDREQSLLGAMEERVRARQSGVPMATE